MKINVKYQPSNNVALWRVLGGFPTVKLATFVKSATWADK
jgi:hypothetical protein